MNIRQRLKTNGAESEGAVGCPKLGLHTKVTSGQVKRKGSERHPGGVLGSQITLAR